MVTSLVGNETATNKPNRRQVYQVTHDGAGLRLPLMNRSFISFTFGGKHIEDFNLIATISGDRLEQAGYAAFEDITSNYPTLDGQQYWSTHHQAHEFTFNLSTDGMDQRELDNFLYWFKAGTTRELVLAEHPNRAILARVSQPPQINMLPFEENVTMRVNAGSYNVKTTLYRGDIELTLVADEPYWYSKLDVLGIYSSTNNGYEDYWYNDNNKREYIYASQDALKILYEDGIPLGSMIGENMLLGSGAYANIAVQIFSKICSPSPLITTDPDPDNPDHWEGAHIEGKINEGTDQEKEYFGRIAGAIVGSDSKGIESLPKNTPAYFFYAGTAPAFTELKFKIMPVMNDEGYIISPKSSIVDSETPYNEIIVESRTRQTIRITTPNIYTSYNQAIKLFKQFGENGITNYAEAEKLLRDSIRHPYARAWALKILNIQQGSEKDTVNIDSAAASTLVNNMKKFLTGTDDNTFSGTVTPSKSYPYAMELRFNSKTGEAKGRFSYWTLASDNSTLVNRDVNVTEEDVGDMLRSNYLIIRDRNYPKADDGRIYGWSDISDITKQYSHRIIHNIDTGDNKGLQNLQIIYKNMYL